jgi:hypothetical protein
MMKSTKQSILTGLSILAAFSFFGLFAQPANRDALIARVNRVSVLSFSTDKPVREARLMIDGKQVASEAFQGETTGFKLAIITPSSRPGASQEVQVHVEVANAGRSMTGPYRELSGGNVYLREYFGPGTNVVLTGWTQLYGLSHLRGGTDLLYDLRVEIK